MAASETLVDCQDSLITKWVRAASAFYFFLLVCIKVTASDTCWKQHLSLSLQSDVVGMHQTAAKPSHAQCLILAQLSPSHLLPLFLSLSLFSFFFFLFPVI